MCPQKLFEQEKVKQDSHNTHFPEVNHNGKGDRQERLIDQPYNVEKLRKRESFWKHELDIFQQNGLNECKVARS